MEPELNTAKYLKTFAAGLKQRIVQFQPQRGSFPTYLVAVALMGFALWVRLAIAPVEAGLQYVTFFPAVTLAVIIGGLWPGLFATVIGLLLATYIFTPPYYSFSSEALRASFWSNMVFLLDGIIVCSSIEAMHRYRSRHAVKLAEAQRQHEQARQLQEEAEALLRRNQVLMQTSMDGIHVMDSQGDIVEANDAFCNMLGYTREEVANLNVADWDAQWTDEELRAKFRELIGKSAMLETRWRRRDGALINVEISTSGVELEGRNFVFASSRDITARKQAEAVLRQHKMMLDTSIDGFWVNDMQGYLLEANEAYAKMSGYSVDELVNMQISQLEAKEQPADVQAHLAKLIAQGYDRFDTRHRRKDGHEIDVEISCTYMAEPPRLVVFCRDITARKQAEQVLHEADRHKNEFLAMLAHELRNPLVPIRNAAHIFGRLAPAEPRVKWAQEAIERQVTHLTRLVDDLLDVSRIARGKIILKREPVELVGLIEQVVQSVRPLAENKRHSLTVRLPEEVVQLDGDPVRLSQVLYNLLDNAVKYTPDGGRIEFAAHMAGPEIEISVRDNGMGIRAELLPHVFDLFQQDERNLDRAQGGLGIGLTLVQRLVEMHGGRVEAHSAGPGEGATFTVWLPTKAMPAQPPKTEAVSSPVAGLRVLVVDDDFAVADSTAVVLEMEGHQARIAGSGPVALEQIAEFRPHVVLLDIGLKGMDGFETAQRLRQLPDGRDLCLVAVTGYAESAIRERALAAGCDHFLVKPVTFQALSNLLDKVAAPESSPL